MYYLIIDTCVWLELGNDVWDTELIDKLTDFVELNKVSIILPDIIKAEWDKHKVEKIIHSSEKSVSGKIKNIKELSNFISSKKTDAIKEIAQLEPEIKENVRRKSQEMMQKIEYLFRHHNTRNITANDQVKLQAVQWGLERKAPLHKKSSMADTLIILNSVYYINAHNLYPCIFITKNNSDFSSIKNPRQIHEDLLQITENVKLEYFTNIGEALNKIEANAISPEAINRIESKSNEILCYRCGARMNDGGWRPSQYGGLTWQHACLECGSIFDTGDFFD